MSNRLENHYALLIGVGECDNPQWSLPVTVKDIQALKSVLIDPDWCGYVDDEQHIRLLYNETATKEAILSGLNWLKETSASNSEATVIVYYSGHGWLNEFTGKYFLVPHDSKTSLLAAEQFNETLKQIHAKRLLVIIDSCHAQGMVSRKDEPNKFKLPPNFIAKSLPEKIIQDFKSGKERAIFSSSTGAEQSWILPDNSMSIYTYHFLAALLGAGNEPGEQYVRISDLIEYLSETVSQTTQNYYHKQQTPIFDLNGTNFRIAFLHGAKGLSQDELNYLKQDPKQMINNLINNANSSVKKPIIKTISEYLKSGLFVYVISSPLAEKNQILEYINKYLVQEKIPISIINPVELDSRRKSQDFKWKQRGGWYEALVNRINKDFDLEYPARRWWREHPSTNEHEKLDLVISYFEKVLFQKRKESKLCIVFDSVISSNKEYQYLFDGLEFNHEVYSFIRYCYNRRQINQDYQRLNFLLLDTITWSNAIENDAQKPAFTIACKINIGSNSELEEIPIYDGLDKYFSLGVNVEAVVDRIWYWTGGNPFLTKKLLHKVVTDTNKYLQGNEQKYIDNLVKQVNTDWEKI